MVEYTKIGENKMNEVKIGQVYERILDDEQFRFVVTYLNKNRGCDIITDEGWVMGFVPTSHAYDTLLAEYPTWIEAVNSKEFKGDK